jgi:hypothetical protein
MPVLDFRTTMLVVFALGTTVYTFYRLFQVLALWQKARQSQAWSSAGGTVLKSRISRSSTFMKGRNVTRYTPLVDYEYSVNGKQYKGKQIMFGRAPAYLSEGRAQAYMDRYPAGSQVTLFYNPSQPRESVLERHFSGQLGDFLIGLLAAVVFWGMVVWFGPNR